MKPIIDHVKATGYADKCVDEAMGVCGCDVCNLARAYLDLRNLGWGARADAYPKLVQALVSLVDIDPSKMNAEVWAERRLALWVLLVDLDEKYKYAPVSGDFDLPAFLRRKSNLRACGQCGKPCAPIGVDWPYWIEGKPACDVCAWFRRGELAGGVVK
ncbi:MAG: hypothetical protein ACYDAK_12945 [Candidatus Limnocylindrales bacterium]